MQKWQPRTCAMVAMAAELVQRAGRLRRRPELKGRSGEGLCSGHGSIAPRATQQQSREGRAGKHVE